MKSFNNGDQVFYRMGLVFTFIGLNPENNEEAYCLHPSALDRNTDAFNTNGELRKRIDLLPVKDLELKSNFPNI